jgi:hypothetical protein
MYAYQIGEKHSKETRKIIREKYWINPQDVSAYMMLTNGRCENILDEQEGMIKAEKIDGVSKALNEDFDSLLNLEFKGK